ncbi:UDP-3-O-acyl-N-acetylglucosamine deacetylase [Tepidamorphus sp. 3E244]|uniref:UDP-3-O-acyl-N-acetylglucosamine deacetylase n=1 Tax=Tepidamorphus sp. 3E244 TaxID=3385498 RepID=UPI0038FD3D71
MRREAGLQKTIAASANLSGIGVHSGLGTCLTLHPAEPDTGIVFLLTDERGNEVEVPATHDNVCCTELCTRLGDKDGVAVATVEHLMAAISALGIDNLVIEVDGQEVPIMDGSAADFVAAIDQAGLVPQGAPRKFIKVLKPVRVEHGSAFGELTPAEAPTFSIAIDFADETIGYQEVTFEVSPDHFRNEISRARTFGFMRDVEALWSAGFALGASLDNTVVVGEDRIVNPEGLRYTDEFVRHKALDAVGDLALAGAPILGCYRSLRGGHRLNVAMVKALLADPDAWTIVEAPVHRAPKTAGRVEAETFAPAAAYGPEVS